MEDILSGNINNNNKKEVYKKRRDGVENVNQLKDYLTKIKDLTDIRDRIKDQKGKRYVNLPILLSELNINSSKELISNIEQLINNLYDNKKITKQVYNILNKAITYKNDS